MTHADVYTQSRISPLHRRHLSRLTRIRPLDYRDGVLDCRISWQYPPPAGRQAGGPIGQRAGSQAGRQACRQAGKQAAGRHAGRQAGRQASRHASRPGPQTFLSRRGRWI